MFKVTEAMGLGMGGMNGTCGAVTGACAIAGMLNSCGDLDKPVSKGATYKVSREISDRFLEETGSLTCRDIKGVDTGKILKAALTVLRMRQGFLKRYALRSDTFIGKLPD